MDIINVKTISILSKLFYKVNETKIKVPLGIFNSEKHKHSPDWCSSVGWVLSCKLKGHQLDSQSGHMHGLQARSLVEGVRVATSWCFSQTSMFLSLSSFLPHHLSKKINKILKTHKNSLILGLQTLFYN